MKDFSGIARYIEELKNQARKKGFAVTLFGRRRYLPELSSLNYMLRSQAERIAVNMPIQGLGADIIKLAMIKTSEFLKTEKLIPDKARLLLSIHDELLFEISDGILKETAAEIKKIMESVYSLTVPLVVDSAAGKNWRELR